MKPVLPLILLTFICHATRAQVEYQPGYFIREDGSKTACLIRNYGWVNNPTSIVYKTSASSGPVTLELNGGITEFKAGNARYVRFDVDVDTSAQELTDSSMPAGPHTTNASTPHTQITGVRREGLAYTCRSDPDWP